MEKLKTIVVDDEKASRTTLKNYLKQYCAEVSVVAEAANITEAKELIEQYDPGLVFLDVEMPFGNGFDLLGSLNKIDFQVVFVTAFSHYALKAIQYSACHYLLKPVDIEELVEAVKRVSQKSDSFQDSTSILLDNIRADQKQKTKVVLPIINGFEVIQAEEVVYCKAEENFTRFRLITGREVMICRALKYYQDILEPLGFLRIHKSYVINLQHVRKYQKGRGGDVTMIDETELPVSPTQKEALVQCFLN